MRILLTADPYLPVPPRHYGGIERIVDLLARGLAGRGHTITLVAHPASRTAGTLVPYGVPPHAGVRARVMELRQVSMALWRRRRQADAVISFGRLAALLPILPLRRLPKMQRYCRENLVPWSSVRKAVRLAGASLRFTGASASVHRDRPRHGPGAGTWHTIFDAVDLATYTFVPKVPPDAPLVFLGRLEPVKGTHLAIRMAREAGRRLVIAGNRVESGSAAGYFEREIAPHLDGERIRHVGAVDDRQKNQCLGAAAALLFPAQCEEAFGIVMAEAMACGTPVVALSRGSVPEVVRHGHTGFVCHSVEESVEAIRCLPEISRQAVRQDCAERFSAPVMVEAFERVLKEMGAGTKPGATRRAAS